MCPRFRVKKCIKQFFDPSLDPSLEPSLDTSPDTSLRHAPFDPSLGDHWATVGRATIGRSLGDPGATIGRPLGDHWGTVGRPLRDWWATIGRPLGDHWATHWATRACACVRAGCSYLVCCFILKSPYSLFPARGSGWSHVTVHRTCCRAPTPQSGFLVPDVLCQEVIF